MKKIFVIILITLCTSSLYAQIKNADFETVKDTTVLLPAVWRSQKIKGFSASLDDSEKHSGKYSFKISNADSSSNAFLSVSQVSAIAINNIKRITINVYIKTNNVKGNVAIWSQLWDENDKQIGFQNTGIQQTFIAGTNEWKQYRLNLIVGKDVKKLFFGAYLSGTGSVWFDDFKIEEVAVSNAPATAEVIKYINDFNSIIKSNSIYRDSLNWPLINEDIEELSKGMKTIDDATVLTDYIVNKLHQAGDHHSFIQPPVVAHKYAMQNTNPGRTSSKLLGNNIGYITVPGFGSGNQQAIDVFANDIQSRIRTLDTQNKIDYWIVDLRNNNGGNLYPMIGGLGPLTGDGILGYFVSMNEKKDKFSPWFYNNKKGKIGSSLGVKIEKPYQLKNPAGKVAVLIGEGTGSSGEMTAISFIGKPNTKLFGQQSSGYTSANLGFKLSDGSMLLLAVSYTADRRKKEYRGKIQPDEIVKEVAGEDATLKAAQEWLLKSN